MIRMIIGISALSMCPLTADVIYSNYLQTAIPLDFNGVTISIGNGQLNPFFGGFALANDSNIQPFRSGTGGLDTVLNALYGTQISNIFGSLATGPGGSMDHLEITFIPGQEGYVGFKLDDFMLGWMRVLFTNNTSGAEVKDWAYDDSGAAITAGGIRQVAQTIQINSDMTLKSSLTNAGGQTNLTIGNSAFATLTANHAYSGTTTVQSGSTLVIQGNIVSIGLLTVQTNARLSGGGSIGGGAVIHGIHNPGSPSSNAGVGSQSFAGPLTYSGSSIFEWDINQSSTSSGYDTVTAIGGITASAGSNFHVKLGSSALANLNNSANTFWNTPGITREWNLSSIFGINPIGSFSSVTTNSDVSLAGSFSIQSTTLTWTAVPEPTTSCCALLLIAGALRRHRRIALPA